ncbi:hypothetical protein HCUR_00004 [Holospora curviuscula]|uniref:Uncharacterized protein n=1 Tax=Holospora curviuscula TaxID=1082868 RepID=A0A2S5RI91_9PROT|nr:hypothetical protein HCUR_00004 [Holospora curviuscula]
MTDLIYFRDALALRAEHNNFCTMGFFRVMPNGATPVLLFNSAFRGSMFIYPFFCSMQAFSKIASIHLPPHYFCIAKIWVL